MINESTDRVLTIKQTHYRKQVQKRKQTKIQRYNEILAKITNEDARKKGVRDT
jgi:hypothetical protein